MSRSVEEWRGKTDDTPLPARVKDRIVQRQEGICACGCGQPFTPKDRPEFDHAQALILGGENREANIQALRRSCHKGKTARDVAAKAKDARVRQKHLGLKPKSRNQPGGRLAEKFIREVGGGLRSRHVEEPQE